jgi:hypothetical protein
MAAMLLLVVISLPGIDAMNAFIGLTDSNIYNAAQLWVSDQAFAISTYGDLREWDVSQVTYMGSSKSTRIWED